MHNRTRSLLLALLLAPFFSLQAQKIYWHSDYSSALEEARETGKPLLISFRCVP